MEVLYDGILASPHQNYLFYVCTMVVVPVVVLGSLLSFLITVSVTALIGVLGVVGRVFLRAREWGGGTERNVLSLKINLRKAGRRGGILRCCLLKGG